MPNIDFSIELHCHPTFKPLGKSYKLKVGVQSANNNEETSLWHYDAPSVFEKLLNYVGGLTKFSQANFTAAAYGTVWVITVSMGSIEKWFFNNKLGTGTISNILGEFATEVSVPRINAIQDMQDYFKDLSQEYEFLREMNDQKIQIEGAWYTYRIVNNFTELQNVITTNELTINLQQDNPIVVAIIPSIEGMHVLNCGLGKPCSNEEVIANARALKASPNKPWFITFTHHFYNELCGHSLSLQGLVAKECDQSTGIDTGFTELGKEVLDILLDNVNGKRILIDIKHLSPIGRKQFFKIHEEKYPDIPIIISHGACNGLPNMDQTISDSPELGNTFYGGGINFYDEEIVKVVNSNGIFGLQLDERRIANRETFKNIKRSIFRNKIMYYRSQLLWNQVQYIAELLDKNDLPAWSNIAIGSDYDGLVDPLNSFWTMAQYPILKSYLERHAYNYMKNSSRRLKNGFNKIDADVIVQNIFHTNAWEFLKTWF